MYNYLKSLVIFKPFIESKLPNQSTYKYNTKHICTNINLSRSSFNIAIVKKGYRQGKIIKKQGATGSLQYSCYELRGS